ncbi:voltage-dependent anion channel [Flammula alnicola]|nr:voltage-dependent anion channel [Flammula alnicola]
MASGSSGDCPNFDAAGFSCSFRGYNGDFFNGAGTGAISSLFVSFPYGTGSRPMIVLSLIIFFLNLFLFTLFSVLVIAKYMCYPDRWKVLVRNPVTSLYAGCFPMGATTLINVAVLVIHQKYHVGGKGFLYFLWAIWWIDIVIAFFCCWVGVHVMFAYQNHSLDSMTAMWLLPVVTLIVASSTGGIVANALQPYSLSYALDTVTISAFMVTVGLTLALMILTIYLLRLIIHGLPQGGTILSVFLPLGPTGQAGFAVLLIGQNYSSLFPTISSTTEVVTSRSAGMIVNVVCTCLSFVLWSLATMWILYALLAVYTALCKSVIAFRISFWGLVFPNGVYANLTIQLANTFNSRAFRVWGAIYAIATLVLWMSIFIRSIWELKTFFAVRKVSDDIPIPEIDIYQPQCLQRQGSNGTSFTQVR